MADARKPKVTGFGHSPERERHHYVVVVPRGLKELVSIYEVRRDSGLYDADDLRCVLSRDRWHAIAGGVSYELNRRLKELELPRGRFKVGGETPVARVLGKELLLLAWAIEDADLRLVPDTIRNWQGLSPEERWWLTTMTGAQLAHASKRGVGWRAAVRYALTGETAHA